MIPLRLSFALLSAGILLTHVACSDDGPSTPPKTDGPVVTADLPPDEPHGRACDNPGGWCKEKADGQDLFCVAVQGSAKGRGYCALQCKQFPYGRQCYGAPNGIWSQCLVDSGPKDDAGTPGVMYCAFICDTPDRSYTCPRTLVCAEERDPRSGRRLCVPPPK